MSRKREDRGDGIFWGLVLVALGVVFLLVQQDILPRDILWEWWMWWPVVLIAYGLVKLARPRDASDVGSGVTMMGFGIWFFANYYEWWGLTWRTSWPLALVAVGAGMVARALAATVMGDPDDRPALESRGKENSRVE